MLRVFIDEAGGNSLLFNTKQGLVIDLFVKRYEFGADDKKILKTISLLIINEGNHMSQVAIAKSLLKGA